MALATTINIQFIDGKGKTSNTKIRVPNTFSIAQYREFAEAIGQLILNVSQGAITGISVNFALDLSALGFKAVAGALGSVTAKMQGLFQTASGLIAKWLLPAPEEEKVTAGSDDFDQTDGDVAALVSAFEDGIAVTAGTITFTNGRGSDIEAVSSLKETFRRRNVG